MPSVIDTQGPLARRKALIAKLMAQMQGGSPEVGGGGGGARAARAHSIPIPSGTGAMSIRPGNLEPRGAMISGLRSAFSQVQGVHDPAPSPPAPSPPAPSPPASEPPSGGGEPPAPPAQWQSEGFVSQDMYNAFQSLSEYDRERVMMQPHLRRRYFG